MNPSTPKFVRLTLLQAPAPLSSFVKFSLDSVDHEPQRVSPAVAISGKWSPSRCRREAGLTEVCHSQLRSSHSAKVADY